MPFISSRDHRCGAVGTQPLSVVDAETGVVWFSAFGGGESWLSPTRMAAVAFGVNGWTWQRVSPGQWTRGPDLWEGPEDATRLHCAEIGSWLASRQAQHQSDWKAWGQIAGNPVEFAGLLCDDMAADGSYVVSGPASNWEARIVWPLGQVHPLPPGTAVRLSPGFACYRLPAEKHIRVLTPMGQIPIQRVGDEQYPGRVFEFSGTIWLYYTTADRGHVAHAAGDATRGFHWPGGDQFGQAVQVLPGGRVAFTWAHTEADIPPYVTEVKALADMVELPSTPVVVPPVDPPDPTEPPVPTPNLLHIADRVRKAFAPMTYKPTENERGQMCITIACEGNREFKTTRFGVSRKNSGNHAETVVGKIATDIVQDREAPLTESLFDCLKGDEFASPMWSEQVYHGDPEKRPWVAPKCDGPDPPPPPPPPIDKDKALDAAAEFCVDALDISFADARQGAIEMWDRIPDAQRAKATIAVWLALGVVLRTGTEHVTVEVLDVIVKKLVKAIEALER